MGATGRIRWTMQRTQATEAIHRSSSKENAQSYKLPAFTNFAENKLFRIMPPKMTLHSSNGNHRLSCRFSSFAETGTSVCGNVLSLRGSTGWYLRLSTENIGLSFSQRFPAWPPQISVLRHLGGPGCPEHGRAGLRLPRCTDNVIGTGSRWRETGDRAEHAVQSFLRLPERNISATGAWLSPGNCTRTNV